MLSVCIIARNEEKNIERCLSALSGLGWELVVVDTGSSDRTREIVKKFTDKLYDFPWCDDFSAAKNYAVSKAEHDWVMVVDSDEFLELPKPEELEKLSRLIAQNPQGVGRVRRRNVFARKGVSQENREWINRIFDRRKFHYEGRIHEQVMPFEKAGQADRGEYQTWLAPLTFVHTGYDLTPKEKQQKAMRNIRLLERELLQAEAEQQEQVPYLLYQLGKSYYMAGEYERSCEYFGRGLSFDLNPKLEYVIDMVETYGYALINSGQEQMALFFENIYEEFGSTADFQFLMGLIYMRNARFSEAIQEFEKAKKHPDCRSVGVNSYAANYNIGVIYECLGDVDKARKYYERCGNYAPAARRLDSSQ